MKRASHTDTHLLRPPAPLLAMAFVLEERLRHREDGREPDARAEEDDGAVSVCVFRGEARR